MYKLNTKQLEEKFETSSVSGLTTQQAEKRLQENGYNELKQPKKESIFMKFLAQFKDVMVLILIAAAIISVVVEPQDWIESVIILFVVLLNAALGVFQENKVVIIRQRSLMPKNWLSEICLYWKQGIVSEAMPVSLNLTTCRLMNLH